MQLFIYIIPNSKCSLFFITIFLVHFVVVLKCCMFSLQIKCFESEYKILVSSLVKEYEIPGTCYSAGCMSYEFKVDYYLRNNPVEYSFVNFEQKCHLMKYSLFNCLKLVVEQLSGYNPSLLPWHGNLKMMSKMNCNVHFHYHHHLYIKAPWNMDFKGRTSIGLVIWEESNSSCFHRLPRNIII